MSASITPMPSRADDSIELCQVHDLQSLVAGPARDNFVARTAVRIEELQASGRILTRKLEDLVSKVAELQEACALEDRWYGFHQSEKRAAENKLEEMVRSYRQLKDRLDRIEVQRGGNHHAYKSFEAVSRKLDELECATTAMGKPTEATRARLLTITAAAVLLSALCVLGLSLMSGAVISRGEILTHVFSAPAQTS
jgi:hypothetical protein